jgi:hypothetical protein
LKATDFDSELLALAAAALAALLQVAVKLLTVDTEEPAVLDAFLKEVALTHSFCNSHALNSKLLCRLSLQQGLPSR